MPQNVFSTTARDNWVLACGASYWPQSSRSFVEKLVRPFRAESPSPGNTEVRLPSWAADIGVGAPAVLLVNSACVPKDAVDQAGQCDWLGAAFFHLTGAGENGRIESYSSRLNADSRIYDRAWVNRIFLLLRRMAARNAGKREEELFGPRPPARFHITHDVDAVQKTPEIRFKQTAFHLFNAARATMSGRPRLMAQKLAHAARFAATTPDYHNFPLMCRLEDECGIRSTFNFYSGPASLQRGSLRQMLLDPSYDIMTLRKELKRLRDCGWRIGLHVSFDAWDDSSAMLRQRQTLEKASDGAVTECRQHWLRFGWMQSWRNQQSAGLALDTTLGFNDRPGLRNGAALRFHPWDPEAGKPLEIAALPMLLMDSHFYDYVPMTDERRKAALAHWIGEVRAVGGEASVNWHVHTLASDYGWADGYRDLLNILA